MSKESPTTVLYELRITVEPTGIVVQQYKYPTKFTGNNYIRLPMTSELEAQGYNSGLYSRVKANDILKVHTTFIGDKTSRMGRVIYYLEGQQGQATLLIRDALDGTIQTMKKQMDALHEAWTTRKDRPRRA